MAATLLYLRTMKKPTKKLSLTTETIRPLQSSELGLINGGSIHVSTISVSTGSSVISIGSGTSVISRNPSGGAPSGGAPSGG
jgi:hypothetical protein